MDPLNPTTLPTQTYVNVGSYIMHADHVSITHGGDVVHVQILHGESGGLTHGGDVAHDEILHGELHLAGCVLYPL